MASLFDYYNQGSGKKAPTGYSFRTSNSGNDVYTPVNINRANNYRRNPGKGGGRSNLDNQRGFSNQGIGSFSNRQPGLFGSQMGRPSNRQPGLFGSQPSQPGMTGRDAAASGVVEEEDKFSFTDKNLGSNIVEDATRMASDLTPDVNMRLPGLAGLSMGMMDSISNNQRDHRYLNSIFGRASPDKTMAFFGKAEDDMRKNIGTDNVGTMQIGDTTDGSSLMQAMKYFDKAGITRQNLDRFYDKNDKFYGNEAYLASQAGGSGAEDFATGMSFIKNAKASANLAEREAMKQQADAAARGVSGVSYDEPDLAFDDILYGEPGYGEPRQSGIDYEAMGIGADPENDLLYGEPGFGEPGIVPKRKPLPDQDEDFYNYPDEKYRGQYDLGPEYDPVMDISIDEQSYMDSDPTFYNQVGRKRGLLPNFGNNLTSQLMYGQLPENQLGVTPMNANQAGQFVLDGYEDVEDSQSIISPRYYDRLFPYSR